MRTEAAGKLEVVAVSPEALARSGGNASLGGEDEYLVFKGSRSLFMFLSRVVSLRFLGRNGFSQQCVITLVLIWS